MSISTNRHGTLEYIATGEVFRHYQVLSNDLPTPATLICPLQIKSPTREAIAWEVLANTNIDYFVGVDASETNPSSLLAGDRWLTSNISITNHLLILGSNATLAWQPTPHGERSNVALGDGSVQAQTSQQLQDRIPTSNQIPLRLAIPQ